VRCLDMTAQAERLGIDRAQVTTVVQDLLDLHHEGLRLAKRLMALQERVDTLDRLANSAIDTAAAVTADEEAVDRAVAVASAAMRAGEEELDATVEWAMHLEQSIAVTSSATELIRRLDTGAALARADEP
jgi:hypothetical protein